MNKENVCFPFDDLEENKNIKVFCFSHAGGSALIFRKWLKRDSEIEVIPVELPGKGTRIGEEAITDFEKLTEQLSQSIAKKINNERFYLFGHSMGAIIAFDIASKLEKIHEIKPEKLIVVGRQAPHFPNEDKFKSYMGDEALIDEMKRVNGTPKEFFENEAFLKFMIPIIRNDYKLNESYEYKGEKINIPIIAHSAKYDYEADEGIMSHWSEVTNNTFKLKSFNGDHFFIYDEKMNYYKELIKEIKI